MKDLQLLSTKRQIYWVALTDIRHAEDNLSYVIILDPVAIYLFLRREKTGYN